MQEYLSFYPLYFSYLWLRLNLRYISAVAERVRFTTASYKKIEAISPQRQPRPLIHTRENYVSVFD